METLAALRSVKLGTLDFTGESDPGLAWVIEGIDGWDNGSATTLELLQKLRAAGGWRSSDPQLTPKVLTLRGALFADSAADRARGVRLLKQAASLRETTLTVDEPGVGPLTLKVSRQDEVLIGNGGDDFAPFSVSLVAADPRKLSPSLKRSTGLPSSSGGLTIPTQIRRNLCPNPNFETDAASWSNYTGLAAPTRVTTNPFSGSGRLQAVGDGTTVNPRLSLSLSGFVAGDVWTLSARIRKDGTFPAGGNAHAALRWQLAPSGENNQALSPAFVPDGNGWMLISVTGTVPANTTGTVTVNLGFVGIASNLTAAGSIGLDEVLLEKASGVQTYFDGSTENDVSKSSWDGAVNASSSTQRVYSLTAPFIIDSVVDTGQIALTNEGELAGPVVARVDGPAPQGVTITHRSSLGIRVFSLNLAIGAGEWVDVDMEAETVLSMGQSSRSQWVTSRGFSAFEPGPNVWAFSAPEASTATLTITATPARE